MTDQLQPWQQHLVKVMEGVERGELKVVAAARGTGKSQATMLLMEELIRMEQERDGQARTAE